DHVRDHRRVVVVTQLQLAGPAPVVQLVVERRHRGGQHEQHRHQREEEEAEPAETHGDPPDPWEEPQRYTPKTRPAARPICRLQWSEPHPSGRSVTGFKDAKDAKSATHRNWRP